MVLPTPLRGCRVQDGFSTSGRPVNLRPRGRVLNVEGSEDTVDRFRGSKRTTFVALAALAIVLMISVPSEARGGGGGGGGVGHGGFSGGHSSGAVGHGGFGH